MIISKKVIRNLFPLFFLIVSLDNYYAQNVGINSSGAAPNVSSMLDVSSTNKGLLLPRMSAVQRDAIGSPATGLLVFVNDDNTFYYYNGTAWVPLFGDNFGWKTLGNANTTAATNFLGTTDAVDLVFRTNNAEVGRFKSGGNLGLNEPSPELPIHSNRTGATTDQVWNAGYFVATKTSAMGDGFGTGIRFRLEDDGGVQNSIAGVEAVRSGTDNSGMLQFATYQGGTLNRHMFILPSGNVGIGTSSPANSLHIVHSDGEGLRLETTNGLNYNFIEFVDDGLGSMGNIGFGAGADTNINIVSSLVGSKINFYTSGSALRMSILDNGNVGIGTVGPVTGLDVVTGTNATGQIIIGSSAQSGRIGFRRGTSGLVATTMGWKTAADDTNFEIKNTSGGGTLEIDASAGILLGTDIGGSVGVGISVPTAKHHIKGGGATSATFASKIDNSAGTSLMVVRDDGRVGVNTSAPGAILDVNGSFHLNRPTVMVDAGNTLAPGSGELSINVVPNDMSATNAAYAKIMFPDNNTVGLLTTFDANIRTSGTQYRDIVFGRTSATYLMIKDGGNVGIGTSSPEGALHVHRPNNTFNSVIIGGDNGTLNTEVAELAFRRSNYNPTEDAASIVFFRKSAGNEGGLRIKTQAAASSLTTRINIEPGGNVGFGTESPQSTVHINGSVSIKRTTTAANYTILTSDYYIGVTSTAAPRTLTLPTAASAADGKVYVIKDESGGAAANNITVSGGASTIDGAASVTISSNYGSLRIVCDGANWFVID